MAMMDAGIAVWDAKYAYWCIRPSQADPAITTPVGLPNFPAYPSGHSGFSGAGSDVLGYLFPSERARLQAMAEEVAMSRLYGGVHFRFDNEAGLQVGRAVAAMAIAFDRARRGQTIYSAIAP
jgi:membrane-associated phospholipid phosphatase